MGIIIVSEATQSDRRNPSHLEILLTTTTSVFLMIITSHQCRHKIGIKILSPPIFPSPFDFDITTIHRIAHIRIDLSVYACATLASCALERAMTTVNLSMLAGSKGAGLALMVGVILAIVAPLFFPGGGVHQSGEPTGLARGGRRPGRATPPRARDDDVGDRRHAAPRLRHCRPLAPGRRWAMPGGIGVASRGDRQPLRLGQLRCRPGSTTQW